MFLITSHVHIETVFWLCHGALSWGLVYQTPINYNIFISTPRIPSDRAPIKYGRDKQISTIIFKSNILFLKKPCLLLFFLF